MQWDEIDLSEIHIYILVILSEREHDTYAMLYLFLFWSIQNGFYSFEKLNFAPFFYHWKLEGKHIQFGLGHIFYRCKNQLPTHSRTIQITFNNWRIQQKFNWSIKRKRELSCAQLLLLVCRILLCENIIFLHSLIVERKKYFFIHILVSMLLRSKLQ